MAYTLNTDASDLPANNGSSDGRPTAQPATRATTITGGTGGGSRSKPVKPFTGAPLIPRAPRPVAPIVVDGPTQPPLTLPPAETPKEETPKGLPAKDPQPPMPTIPTANRPITVRPERYRVGQTGWEVNAVSEGLGEKPNITPLKFDLGKRPELKPLLRINGVVVRVGEHYLVSPQTLADIRDAGNPHYDIIENGRILNTPMGKTVPIVDVSVAGLEATGSRRDIVNGFAAVKSVDYVYETPTVMGVPEGILEQINYTLDTTTQRPEDSFQIWELNLTGDYSIEKLKIDNAQADGKLDKAKLEAFTKGVGDRIKLLQKDLNIIKGIFYRGELAEADRKTFVTVTRRATSDDTEEEILKPDRSNYVIKTVEVVAHQATPNSTQPTDAATATSDGPVKDAVAVALPETETSPTDGVIPPEINRAGLERAKLLVDWNSYGFTPAEKAELKSTGNARKPLVKVADGTEVGIGAVRWSPTVADKARVLLPYTEGPDSYGRMSFEAQRKWRDKWYEYYGFGNSNNLLALNRQRIAELIHLAAKVKELELAESKNY